MLKNLGSKISEAFQGSDVREGHSRTICTQLQKVLHDKDFGHCPAEKNLSYSERKLIVIGAARDIVKQFFEEGKPKQANALIDHLKADLPDIKWSFDLPVKKSDVSRTPLGMMIRA